MKVCHIGEAVTGINREPTESESVLEVSSLALVWGMCLECYSVVNNHLLPVSAAEKAIIEDADELSEAKKDKKEEIKKAYADAESVRTITAGGGVYAADMEHLTVIDLERRLAEANGETEMIVFDVDFNPRTVALTAVDTVMQDMRAGTKENYQKAKNLIRQINLAVTLAEVESIIW